MSSTAKKFGSDEADESFRQIDGVVPTGGLSLDKLSIQEPCLPKRALDSMMQRSTPVAAIPEKALCYDTKIVSPGGKSAFSKAMYESFVQPTDFKEHSRGASITAVPQVLERIFDFLHPVDGVLCTLCSWLFREISEERIDFKITEPKNSTLLIEWSYSYTVRYVLRLWKQLMLAEASDADVMVKALYAGYEKYALEMLLNASAGAEFYTGLKGLIFDVTPQPVHALNTLGAANGGCEVGVVTKPPRFQCNGRDWARVIRHITNCCGSTSLEHFAVFDSRSRNSYPPVHFYRELKYGELLAQMPLLRTVFMPSLQRLYAAESAYSAIGVAGQASAPLTLWQPVIKVPAEDRLPFLERMVLPNSSLADIIITNQLNADISISNKHAESLQSAIESVQLTFPSAKCVVECGGMSQINVNDKICDRVFPQARQFVTKHANSHYTASIRRTNLATLASLLIDTSYKELPIRFNELVMGHIEQTYQMSDAASLQLFQFTGKRAARQLPRHRFFVDSRDIVGGSFTHAADTARKRLYDLDCLQAMLHMLPVRDEYLVCEAVINWINPGMPPLNKSGYATGDNSKRQNLAVKVLQTMLSFWRVPAQQQQLWFQTNRFSSTNGLNLVLVAAEPLNKLLTTAPLFPEDAKEIYCYHLRHVKFVQHIKFPIHFSNIEKLVRKFEEELIGSFTAILQDARQCVSAAGVAASNAAGTSGLRYAVYQHLRRLEFRIDLRYDSDARDENEKLKRMKASGCRVEPSSDDDDDDEPWENLQRAHVNVADEHDEDDDDDDDEEQNMEDGLNYRVRARGGVARREQARVRAKFAETSVRPLRRDDDETIEQRRIAVVKMLGLRAPVYEKTLKQLAFDEPQFADDSSKVAKFNSLGRQRATELYLPLPRLISVRVIPPPFVDVD